MVWARDRTEPTSKCGVSTFRVQSTVYCTEYSLLYGVQERHMGCPFVNETAWAVKPNSVALRELTSLDLKNTDWGNFFLAILFNL